MQGVSLCIKWHAGNTTWVALGYIKEDYPIQLADYLMAAKFSMDPAFAWLVPHTLKKRNCIVAKVKSKYWLKTQQSRIKVPKNMKQAIDFDRENGNTLLWDAVCQDMKNGDQVPFDI